MYSVVNMSYEYMIWAGPHCLSSRLYNRDDVLNGTRSR